MYKKGEIGFTIICQLPINFPLPNIILMSGFPSLKLSWTYQIINNYSGTYKKKKTQIALCKNVSFVNSTVDICCQVF